MQFARGAPVRAATMAAVASCAVLLQGRVPLAAQARQGPEITWDFETGDLRGWRATGDAFRFQPIRGDNVMARGRGQVSNHVGAWWVGTFEHNEGPGAFQGDGPQGTLTSEAFTIPDSITFRVGGGSSFETRAELLYLDAIEGEIRILIASGQNVETMRRHVWDTRQWTGRQGRIRIVDASSGPWGHINVDDFQFHRPGFATMVPGFQVVQPQAPVGVPPLIGRRLEEVGGLLEQFRLRLGEVGRVRAGDPPGTVLSQDPAPETRVPAGTPVNVTVSEWIAVPQLVRSDTLAAWRILDRVGLRRGRVVGREADVPPGTILSQSPEAGSPAPPESPVSVVVATPMPTVVPPLVELDPGRAAAVLGRAFLELGRIEERQSDQPVGTVVDQRPAAGTEVPRGTQVDVVVARGVEVPDVRGGDAAAASARLADARLGLGAVREEPSPGPMGTVLTQSPPPGAEVPLGSRVDVVVAQGVQVPDVVGATRADAGRRLGERALSLGRIVGQPSSEPLGTVLAQEPAAGSVVPLRTVVDVVLATGVAVPGVIGRGVGAARTELEAAALSGGQVAQEMSTSPPGTVLSQSPAAGTLVPLGTPVAMVVARGVEVPSLASLDSLGATDSLRSVGLVAGSVTRRWAGATPGTVVEQSPPAGDVVASATAVSVVLSSWPSVPDVTTLDSAAARRAVADSGLVLNVGARRWSWRRAVEVLGQEPPAGASVAPATPVTVVVARPVPLAPLGAGLLLLVAVGSIVRVRTRTPGGDVHDGRRHEEPPEDGGRQDADNAPDSPLRVVPRIDGGRARMLSPPPRVTLEVRLRPEIDAGRQSIERGAPAVVSETVLPGVGPPTAAPDPHEPEEPNHG